MSIILNQLALTNLNLIYQYDRDIWRLTPTDGCSLTSGSTLFSLLRLPRHFTDKRRRSLIWPVFLWDPSWGKSDNGWRRVYYCLHHFIASILI